VSHDESLSPTAAKAHIAHLEALAQDAEADGNTATALAWRYQAETLRIQTAKHANRLRHVEKKHEPPAA
jgi:hypothetical protein